MYRVSLRESSHHTHMYVCMYRGRPSWRCPWDRAFQLGQGEGPIGIVGPISQPRGAIDTASLMLDHIYTLNVRFLIQLYSRQLRVSCVLTQEVRRHTGPSVFILLILEGLQIGRRTGISNPDMTSSAGGAKGCSDHRFRAPPAYTANC